jgi:Predicted integral membrane protein (DUF2275)
MNCQEVQKFLSEFLDQSLDVERFQTVSDHLAACSLCSEEMASLAECQRLVSGLPAVEPPMGFTTRVMAHVRDAARKPSLWDRLFSPLRIKIPLQATAVVLIAVLAVYIYQKEPLQRESEVSFRPENSFEKQGETDKLAAIETPAPTAPAKTKQVGEETKAHVQEFKDSAQLKKPQSLSITKEQHEPTEGNQLVAPRAARSQEPIRPPATFTPTPLQEKSPAASEADSPRMEQSSAPGEARRKRAPQSEKESASRDTAFRKRSSEPVERTTASSLDPLSSGAVIGAALPADRELTIRLSEPVRDDKNTGDRLASGGAQSELRSLTLQEEAKNFDQARKHAVQTGQLQTVWVTTARNQYPLFKKELAELGNIEVESSTPELKSDAIAKSSDRLRIKVTILPPPSSAKLSPSEPSRR